MNFVFRDTPGCSSLHNNVSFVATNSILTLVYTCFANITVNSTLFFMTICIGVRISNFQFVDRKSKVKFREPLLTRFLFLSEL